MAKKRQKRRDRGERRSGRNPDLASVDRQAPRWRRALRWSAVRIWKLVVAVSVFAGLVTAYFSLSSRVVIEPQEPYNKKNPFYATFSIKNESYLPVYNLNISCVTAPIEVDFGGESAMVMTVSGVDQQLTGARIEKLAAWEARTFNCLALEGRLVKELPSQRRLNVNVKYVPPVFHSERSESFPFRARRNSEGNFVWHNASMFEQ